jgi:Ni/Fe-hydrogenase subunit HybB-like protein
MEVVISVGLVALGFAAFALAVRFLPVFPERAHSHGHGLEEPPAAVAARG